MREKLIEGVLENFDFDKVRKTMEFLEWKWSTTPEPDSVPTTFQIIKSAKERLEDAYKYAMEDKRNGTSYCGGLKAFAEYNKETSVVDYLELEFVLTGWSEQIDDE